MAKKKVLKKALKHKGLKVKTLLSACLAGVNCVYDGSNKKHPVFLELLKNKKAVIFCPEMLGGLKAPHAPSEIEHSSGGQVLKGVGRVLSCDGKNVTEFFVKGAQKTLEIAKKQGIKKAIMKARSPSCGCGLIYDGTFSKQLIEGDGVATALLKAHGIEVISDEEYLKDIGYQATGNRATKNKKKTCSVIRGT
jgi:uncharacterized protein YbbK (DUF523 family)